ncbi:MAG: trypsin-like peptidase domain-containing protein, partial [Acidimicrobiia bacterium]
MPNDTPENTPEDSHPPFISERNEHTDSSVLSDMDNTTTSSEANSPQEVDSRQSTADSGEQVDSSQPTADSSEEAPSQQPTADGGQEVDSRQAPDSSEVAPSQQPTANSQQDAVDVSPFTRDGSEVVSDAVTTGEIEIVDGGAPPGIDSLEGMPTVAFDYDDYYGFPDSTPTDLLTSEQLPPAAPPHKDRAGLMFLGALAAGVLGAVITVGVFAATGSLSTQETIPPTTVATAAPAVTTVQPQVTNQIINGVGSSINPTAVALKVVPSIVTVDVFDQGDGEAIVGTGSGSGVVMSADGFIVTNNHVVENSTVFEVTFEDGRTYEAELVGTDPLTDLAVLKISADNLVPVEFGSSDALVVGDPAV